MLIYKVLRAPEWASFDAEGAHPRRAGRPRRRLTSTSPPPRSFRAPLARHFAGETGAMLLAVDAGAAGAAVRWEPARGGALFPHLYRPLERADVLWARPLADGPAGPLAPDGLA